MIKSVLRKRKNQVRGLPQPSTRSSPRWFLLTGGAGGLLIVNKIVLNNKRVPSFRDFAINNLVEESAENETGFQVAKFLQFDTICNLSLLNWVADQAQFRSL